MIKKLLLAFVFLALVTGVAACGNGDDDQRDSYNGNGETDNGETDNGDADNGEDDLREFTLEELANYDGLDGRDAYVAVDGYVYDMTDSSYWNDGNHQGQVQAGQDLTDEIDGDSPHGRSTLDRVPKIGILVDED